jgi:uncharacterized protein YceK
MRALVLAFACAAMLGGCASYIESAYDSEARENCQAEVARVGAESCYERVDRERRERRREN